MILKIISAEQILFEGEVTSVTLPGSKGQFTVLQNHASLISTLQKGKITYTANAKVEEKAVDGGIADIDKNVVSVCIY
jgi:F-type H+-transporting ATPase subunit epsilon